MRLKTVIIDDDPKINSGLSKHISKSDKDFDIIATFTNGIDALDFIKTNHVDIVITDIFMHNSKNVNIPKALYEANKYIDVIIVSGHKNFECAIEALKCNVHHYITKPIDYSDLSAALSDIKLKKIQKNDFSSYILRKTLVDIYNNIITIKHAKNILNCVSFDYDKCNYINISIKFSNLAAFLETQWNYGKEQFYTAVSNIINDTRSLTGSPINKFYFLSARTNTLEFVYVGKDILENATDNLTTLIEENLNLNTEILIKSASVGLEAFSRQFDDDKKSLDDSTREDFLIQRVKAYIEQNYMHDISLHDAAAYVNLNHIYFSKFFKQRTGINFIDYIIELRLKKAVELLKEKKYTTLEISHMVGYQSHTYFLRLFKSHLGCSPKEFLRRYLLDEEA